MRAVINSLKKALLLVVVSLYSEVCFAQIIVGDTFLDTYAATYVKSVEEFMRRFNSEEIHPDLDTTHNDNLRLRSILTLFDLQKFQVKDSTTARQIVAFADTVCHKDIRLALDGTGLFAEACCSFLYKQNEVPIDLVFVFEPVRDDIYKWAIVGANGMNENKILNNSRDGYINPTQHEVRFTELSTACKDLTRFLSVNKSVDQLSYLLGMLQSEQLKFGACNKVRFHFLQVPGYVFIVDEVNRLSNNSGYLINTLLETNGTDKQKYVSHLIGNSDEI